MKKRCRLHPELEALLPKYKNGVPLNPDGNGSVRDMIFRTRDDECNRKGFKHRQRVYPAVKCLKCSGVFKKSECWDRQDID